MTCYNTDGRGVTAALRQAGAKLQGDAIVICGTGAVAAITTLELLRLQAASITVVSRDSARAAAMLATIADGLAAADMAKTARHTKLVALSYADTTQLEAALSQATVIIDATTRGKDPNASPLIPVAFIGANHLVLDVNYQSCSSALLREAGKNGAICLDGLDMLVEQAALSIEIWAAHSGLRLTAPRTLMRKVAVVARQARDSTKQLVEE
jgi:shikimate dehydrogenase